MSQPHHVPGRTNFITSSAPARPTFPGRLTSIFRVAGGWCVFWVWQVGCDDGRRGVPALRVAGAPGPWSSG